MSRVLKRDRDLGLLILRLGIGLAFFAHGLPKMMGGPQGWSQLGQAMDHFGIHSMHVYWGFVGAAIETAGGLLLAAGLFFRWACLFLTLQMIVAIVFHLHQAAPLNQFGPGWSHAMELGVVCLSLVFIGPGKWSVDRELTAAAAPAR